MSRALGFIVGLLGLLVAPWIAPLSAAAQPVANPPAETLPAIVLLLPGEATPFARAAEAVRAGFFAAHAADGAPMAIESRDTDESPAAVAAAIEAAAGRGARMIVGPLSRSAVDALARGGGARLPVLALNAPSDAVALPPTMLAFGLRVEDEARFVVEALLRAPPAAGVSTEPAAFAVLVGGSPLGRRAGAAFAAALRERGRRAETMELSLRQERLAEVGDRIAARPWQAILLALDAGEAAAVRPWLPPGSTVVATSRVYLGEDAALALAQELEGVAFVDMPWLVEPDHPAVMTYPRAAAAYSAELDRLYALGIDAYRIAAEWLRGTARFEVDGVTGHLLVDATGGRVERSPVLAVFAEGRVRRRDVLQ